MSTDTPLADLPLLTGSIWSGSRRKAGFEMEDDTPVDTVVWVTQGSLELRTAQVVPSTLGASAVWEALQVAMREPAQGEPGRPERVVVDDHSVMRALKGPLAALSIPLSYRSKLPEVDAAMEFVTNLVSSPEVGYMNREDADEAVVAAFFEQAARFWEAAPWEDLTDVDFIRADLPSGSVVFSVLGQSDIEYGLSVWEDEEQARRFLEVEDEEKVHHLKLFLNYETEESIGLHAYAEARKHGWALAGDDRYPLAANPSEEQGTLAGPADLRLLSQLMEVTLEGARRGCWDREEGEETLGEARVKWFVGDWPD